MAGNLTEEIAGLRDDFREQHDPGDSWGSVISALFDVSEEIERGGGETPDHWDFRAGAMGVPAEPETYYGKCIEGISAGALAEWGETLYRWERKLTKLGRSY